ncbi:MAG: pyrimidine/purine nucleoside phosphorylase [Polyangiaceae bacterium]|nr:pyrimidine/purine nucleoside phosphorylase [Polyangiaceae bacterium]
MLKHSTYFDGNVQSLGFERNGARATVGVIAPGSYRFDTGAAERMTVISGELEVKQAGDSAWKPYPAGTAFEVPAKSAFDVRATGATAYLCEFLGA